MGPIINISGTNARNAGNLSGGAPWAISIEPIVATGGAGRSGYY